MTVVEFSDDLSNSPEAWDRRAEHFGSEASACLWTESGMRVRHRRIAEIVEPLLREGDALYDHGCGTAHLRDSLGSALRATGARYVGWDRSPGMRERARLTRPGIDVPEDRPADADVVVACGVYNLGLDWGVGRTAQDVVSLWERYRPRALVLTLRTGPPDDAHIAYSPVWIASLAHSLARQRWLYDGATLPHEAFLTVLGEGR